MLYLEIKKQLSLKISPWVRFVLAYVFVVKLKFFKKEFIQFENFDGFKSIKSLFFSPSKCLIFWKSIKNAGLILRSNTVHLWVITPIIKCAVKQFLRRFWWLQTFICKAVCMYYVEYVNRKIISTRPISVLLITCWNRNFSRRAVTIINI